MDMKKNRNKLIIDNLIEDRLLLLIFPPLIATVVGGLVYFLHTWKAEGTLETAAKGSRRNNFTFFLTCWVPACPG